MMTGFGWGVFLRNRRGGVESSPYSQRGKAVQCRAAHTT